jgi:hypothetical protein
MNRALGDSFRDCCANASQREPVTLEHFPLNLQLVILSRCFQRYMTINKVSQSPAILAQNSPVPSFCGSFSRAGLRADPSSQGSFPSGGVLTGGSCESQTLYGGNICRGYLAVPRTAVLMFCKARTTKIARRNARNATVLDCLLARRLSSTFGQRSQRTTT